MTGHDMGGGGRGEGEGGGGGGGRVGASLLRTTSSYFFTLISVFVVARIVERIFMRDIKIDNFL